MTTPLPDLDPATLEAAYHYIRMWQRHHLLRQFGDDGLVLSENLSLSAHIDTLLQTTYLTASRAKGEGDAGQPNPYLSLGKNFEARVGEGGRHSINHPVESLPDRIEQYSRYVMENAKTTGDALLVTDLIQAAKRLRALPHPQASGDGRSNEEIANELTEFAHDSVYALENARSYDWKANIALAARIKRALDDKDCHAPKAQVADGYKLVPVEPTEEMYAAAEREWDGRMSARSRGAWQAMIAASPDRKGG